MNLNSDEMKDKSITVTLWILTSLLSLQTSLDALAQKSMSIGTTSINNNAVLWLNSPGKNQGLIIPVVSNKTDVTGVSGMVVFDDSDKYIYYHNGTEWVGPIDTGNGAGGTTFTAGTGINIVGTVITNTGDTNATDDLTTTSLAGGELTGTFANLQLGAAVVTDSKVAANANIAGTKVNPDFGGQDIITTGFTQLGDNAPAIKTAMVSGTTAATEGGFVNVSFAGITTGDKVLSISVLVEWQPGSWIPSNYISTSGFFFSWSATGTSIFVTNEINAGAIPIIHSNSILSKPVRVFLTYME
jgi:hypothetical protein